MNKCSYKNWNHVYDQLSCCTSHISSNRNTYKQTSRGRQVVYSLEQLRGTKVVAILCRSSVIRHRFRFPHYGALVKFIPQKFAQPPYWHFWQEINSRFVFQSLETTKTQLRPGLVPSKNRVYFETGHDHFYSPYRFSVLVKQKTHRLAANCGTNETEIQ